VGKVAVIVSLVYWGREVSLMFEGFGGWFLRDREKKIHIGDESWRTLQMLLASYPRLSK
jgi:hypothetical protein